MLDRVEGRSTETRGASAISGRAMDRKVAGNRTRRLKQAFPVALLAVIVTAAIAVFVSRSNRPHQVSFTDVEIATVERGSFSDTVLTRAVVEYVTSVRLNAGQGGTVREVFARGGDAVEAGDPIFRMSNPVLEREALSRRVEIKKRLTELATARYDITLKTLDYGRSTLELDHEIARLDNRIDIWADLVKTGAASPLELEELKTKRDLQIELRRSTLESQVAESELADERLAGLKGNEAALRAEQALTDDLLDALVVRAPISGQLTELTAEIGLTVEPGQTAGRIDDTENKRLVAQIDEFYLTRVQPGLTASADTDTGNLDLVLTKVFPEVTGGTFKVELEPVGADALDFTRGQSLRVDLTLGDPTDAVTIRDAGFTQATGGNWAFVVGEDGTASRRNLVLGRRSDVGVEVLQGLLPGERVIVSPYDPYVAAERLALVE